jgi:hypothetical protein
MPEMQCTSVPAAGDLAIEVPIDGSQPWLSVSLLGILMDLKIVLVERCTMSF